MTQEIVQVTDWTAIEDAIELWANTGSGLINVAPIEDDKGNKWSRVNWAGYRFKRERPNAVLTIIGDNSPGRACTSKGLINEAGTDKYQTVYKYKYDWAVQIAFYQDSYDSDGKAIRTTARQYAKTLLDSYQMDPIRKILTDQRIGYAPISRTVQGDVLPDTDDDKYIHQAIIEFRFNGINERAVKDSDYFTSITTPTEDNGDLILSGE